jgi:hypothetical protein
MVTSYDVGLASILHLPGIPVVAFGFEQENRELGKGLERGRV